MKLLFTICYVALCLFLFAYVVFPSPDFPDPPDGAVQSFEPADTETPLRRAYFVNQDREEVVSHYKDRFKSLPTLRLNYPPEEAQTIIRDQTRSSYLEELVHPLRESVFINGFVPKEEKDVILVGDRVYYQKITIRYVPSSVLVRALYVVSVSVIFYLLLYRFVWLARSLTKWMLGVLRK